MVDWEYRGSAVHTILIYSYQKKANAEFARLGERRTYCTCLLLQIKRAGSLFERGVSIIFKGKKMTRIISLNTTLKSLENQNASQTQHKRAAKKDFWWNKLEMYRFTSQITWRNHLTSPRLQRTTWALFIQMEGAEAPKGMDYKEKSSAGAFDV